MKLIGRECEQETLTSVVDAIGGGSKRGLLLVGAPGIGKTTLLQWAFEYAVERGILTAWVRAPASAGLPPRFPIGELLQGLIDSCRALSLEPPDPLARVVDTLRGATSATEYPADLPQIANALEITSSLAPVILFIDDLHWVPTEAMEILEDALRLAAGPMGVVATQRPHVQRRAFPVEPSADLRVTRIDVERMCELEVAGIAELELGRPILSSLSMALHAQSCGNPFYALETLRTWREEGALVTVGGRTGIANTSHRGLTRSALGEMLGSRLSRTSSRTQSVATVLAAFGRETAFDELLDATGLPRAQLVEAIAALERGGVASSQCGPPLRIRFTHPLHESSALASVGPARRAEVHERILLALQTKMSRGHPVRPSELAHHAVNALQPPAGMTDLLASAAAESERSGAHKEAAAWYEHLAYAAADDKSRLQSALEGQARTTMNFDPSRAVALFGQALSLALAHDDRAAAGLLIQRAKARRMSGDFGSAVTDLDRAMQQAEPHAALEVRHARAVLHGIAGRTDIAEAELRELAHVSRGTPTHAKAIGHLGYVAFIRGDVAKGRRLWRQALRDCSSGEYQAYLRPNLAWADVILGEWVSAAEQIAHSLQESLRSGDLWNEHALLCGDARLQAWMGNVSGSLDSAHRAMGLSALLVNPTCEVAARDAMTIALLEAGRHAEAAAVAEGYQALMTQDLEPRELSLSLTAFAEASLLTGNPDVARHLVDQAREHLQGARFVEGMVDRCEAQILMTSGKSMAALDLLDRWRSQPSAFAYEQGRIHEVASLALEARGSRIDAAQEAQRGMAIFRALGAARVGPLAARLDGLAPRPRGRPRSILPEGLTPREVEVLRLIRQGKTDREIATELFISPRTAKKHAENLRRKLAVSRRTQVAIRALNMDLDDPSKA